MIELQPAGYFTSHVADIIRAYAKVRPKQAPFPIEAALLWIYLNEIQRNLSISGDVCELGVQYGGTAFLALQLLKEKEKLCLIDTVRTQEFSDRLERFPQDIQDRVTFYECRTDAPLLSELINNKYRWVHIDAGHTFALVLADLKRFAPAVSSCGLLVLDDFLQPRWPAVTHAILHFMEHQSEFAPLFIGFNKVYFVRRTERDRYIAMINNTYSELFNGLGSIMVWEKVEFLGDICFAARGNVSNEWRSIFA